MLASSKGFAAPPARQAAIKRLAGKRGAARPVSQSDFDLPLTAFFRRHTDALNATVIIAAAVGAAAFGVPFLLLLAR